MTHPAREAEQIKESPAEGVYIHGLYLDGCAWSGRENKLVDAEPKKLFNPLPVLYVTGVLVRYSGCSRTVNDVCACFRCGSVWYVACSMQSPPPPTQAPVLIMPCLMMSPAFAAML